MYAIRSYYALAACIALFFAVKGSLLAPLVLLVLFNVPHLWMRLFGFVRGYLLGVSVVEIVQRHRLPDLSIRLKEVMVVILGGLTAYLAVSTCRGEEISAGWGLLALPLLYFYAHLARKGVSRITSYNVCYTKLLRIWCLFALRRVSAARASLNCSRLSRA